MGMGNSVMDPPTVILPMAAPKYSVNHRFPSGAAVMPRGYV